MMETITRYTIPADGKPRFESSWYWQLHRESYCQPLRSYAKFPGRQQIPQRGKPLSPTRVTAVESTGCVKASELPRRSHFAKVVGVLLRRPLNFGDLRCWTAMSKARCGDTSASCSEFSATKTVWMGQSSHSAADTEGHPRASSNTASKSQRTSPNNPWPHQPSGSVDPLSSG